MALQRHLFMFALAYGPIGAAWIHGANFKRRRISVNSFVSHRSLEISHDQTTNGRLRNASDHLQRKVPRHLAIIPDGNGRWATARGLPRSYGHLVGAERMKEVVDACVKLGVQRLTLYAFSTENWKRSEAEVSALWRVIEERLRVERHGYLKDRVRVVPVGQLHRLPLSLQQLLEEIREEQAALDENEEGLLELESQAAVTPPLGSSSGSSSFSPSSLSVSRPLKHHVVAASACTSSSSSSSSSEDMPPRARVGAKPVVGGAGGGGWARMTLVLALSYGGRAEIVDAAKALAQQAAAGSLDPNDIDEARFQRALSSRPRRRRRGGGGSNSKAGESEEEEEEELEDEVGSEDVDVVLRTGGERRLSNFLLWSLAYAELHHSDKLWPDFQVSDLERCFADFACRERRYGKETSVQ